MKNILRLILILNISIFSTSCSWLNEDLEPNKDTEASFAPPDENKTNNNRENIQEKQAEIETKKERVIPSKKEQASGKKIESHYGILIEDLGMQIKKLRSELDFLNQEVYALKAQSQVWENPFSIYNKEIVKKKHLLLI